MKYPYANRDLFLEPEWYSFAECSGSSFLTEWRTSRNQTLNRLRAWTCEDSSLELEEIAAMGETMRDAVSLYRTLSSLREDLQSGRISIEDGKHTIAPYVVKYEVFKRLFSFYGKDGRKHPQSPTADLPTYVRFAQCLAEISERGQSLKHLSVLLKICDALASQAVEQFSLIAASEFADVLNTELRLVAELEVAQTSP